MLHACHPHAHCAQYLPSLVLIPVVGVCLGLGYRQFLAFYLSGTYLSWLYLRFFQQQPDSPLYGDASDDFKCVRMSTPLLMECHTAA